MCEERKCQWCGADISHKQKGAKWCSKQCASNADYHKHRDKRRAQQNNRRRELRGLPSLIGRACMHCGESFNAVHARQVYCSPSCRNKAKYHRAFAKDPEKIRAKQAQWRRENAQHRSDYMKARRKANPEHNLNLQREYRARNRDKINAQAIDRYWKNPDLFRSRQNEWERRKGAEAALSALILPINVPEVSE